MVCRTRLHTTTSLAVTFSAQLLCFYIGYLKKDRPTVPMLCFHRQRNLSTMVQRFFLAALTAGLSRQHAHVQVEPSVQKLFEYIYERGTIIPIEDFNRELLMHGERTAMPLAGRAHAWLLLLPVLAGHRS